VAYAYRHLADVDGIDIETEYAGDIWVAARLGIRVARAPNQTRFDAIGQPWLRRAVKRWARLRLGSGKTFGTVHIDVKALVWFSRYLCARDVAGNSEAAVNEPADDSESTEALSETCPRHESPANVSWASPRRPDRWL